MEAFKRIFNIVDEDGLGNFQLEPIGRNTGRRQRLDDNVAEIGAFELKR